MRRGLTSTVVVTVLVALVAVLLLIWGSSNGSPLIRSPQGTWGPPPLTLPTAERPEVTLSPPPTAIRGEEEPGPNLNQYIVDAIQVFVLLALLFGGLHLLRALMDRDKQDRQVPTGQVEEELQALLEASGEEVRYRALSQGDPRNAVVACWVALEDAVHRFGLEQDPTQTASELTGSVLARWDVDPRAIRSLSAAYREARFSRHPITEEQRRAAVAALEKIHQDLSRRTAHEQIR